MLKLCCRIRIRSLNLHVELVGCMEKKETENGNDHYHSVFFAIVKVDSRRCICKGRGGSRGDFEGLKPPPFEKTTMCCSLTLQQFCHQLPYASVDSLEIT